MSEWDDDPTTVDRTPTTAPHDLREVAARHEGREDVFRALYADMRATGTLTPSQMDQIVLSVRARLTRL